MLIRLLPLFCFIVLPYSKILICSPIDVSPQQKATPVKLYLLRTALESSTEDLQALPATYSFIKNSVNKSLKKTLEDLCGKYAPAINADKIACMLRDDEALFTSTKNTLSHTTQKPPDQQFSASLEAASCIGYKAANNLSFALFCH